MYTMFSAQRNVTNGWIYSHLAGALHDLVEDLPQAEEVHETVGAGHRSHLSTAAARHSGVNQLVIQFTIQLVILYSIHFVTQLVIQFFIQLFILFSIQFVTQLITQFVIQLVI
jgi:hypothetical protein